MSAFPPLLAGRRCGRGQLTLSSVRAFSREPSWWSALRASSRPPPRPSPSVAQYPPPRQRASAAFESSFAVSVFLRAPRRLHGGRCAAAPARTPPTCGDPCAVVRHGGQVRRTRPWWERPSTRGRPGARGRARCRPRAPPPPHGRGPGPRDGCTGPRRQAAGGKRQAAGGSVRRRAAGGRRRAARSGGPCSLRRYGERQHRHCHVVVPSAVQGVADQDPAACSGRRAASAGTARAMSPADSA